MSPRLESLNLSVDGQTIAAIRQSPQQQSADTPRLLCLHGWLDNANSFLPLLPALPSLDIVAIDLPGHGYSSPAAGGYSINDMMVMVVELIEMLGWQQCHLLGHSLGGCIAPMVAVAVPERVARLILVEASGPLSEPADQWPERLQRAMQDRQTPDKFQSRTFAHPDEAVAARLKVARMQPMSARLIIDRQLRESAGGYQWRFDPRLRQASFQYQTEAQVCALLAAVSCPTLTVIAENGFLSKRATQTESRLAQLGKHESVTLPGHHHLHMDTPEPVATAINAFLGTRPALGG